MNKYIIPLILAVIFIGTIIFYYSGRDTSTSDRSDSTAPTTTPSSNVKTKNGKQIIEINAWGGYSPQETVAKANIPTIIRVTTNKTFDCSSSLILPSLRIQKNLPQSGTTDIEIPTQKLNSSLRGLCAMGMYNFKIKFN